MEKCFMAAGIEGLAAVVDYRSLVLVGLIIQLADLVLLYMVGIVDLNKVTWILIGGFRRGGDRGGFGDTGFSHIYDNKWRHGGGYRGFSRGGRVSGDGARGSYHTNRRSRSPFHGGNRGFQQNNWDPNGDYRRGGDRDRWHDVRNMRIAGDQDWTLYGRRGDRRVADQDRGRHVSHTASRVTSIFVSGFPIRVTGLWILSLCKDFGRVLDVFVAQTRTRSGDRFAFVRYGSKEKATRAAIALNGRWESGRKLYVNIAKGGGRQNFWRRKQIQRNQPQERRDLSTAEQGDIGTGRDHEGSPELVQQVNNTEQDSEVPKEHGIQARKTVSLQLDQDRMKMLESCFLVITRRCFSSEYLIDRFRALNLSALWISRMSARCFVIGCCNDDIRNSLIKENWKCIEEWFSEVIPWQPDLGMEERIARLQVQGLPLALWNKDNLAKIAQLWGEFVSGDGVANIPDDSRFCTIHVLTNDLTNILDEVDIEFNGWSTTIQVCEVAPDVFWKSAIDGCAIGMEMTIDEGRYDWSRRGESRGPLRDASNVEEDIPMEGDQSAYNSPQNQGSRGFQILNIMENPNKGRIPAQKVSLGGSPNFTQEDVESGEYLGDNKEGSLIGVCNIDSVSISSTDNIPTPPTSSGRIHFFENNIFDQALVEADANSSQSNAVSRVSESSLEKSNSDVQGIPVSNQISLPVSLNNDLVYVPIEIEEVREEDKRESRISVEIVGAVSGPSRVRKRRVRKVLDVYGGKWGPRLSQTIQSRKGKQKIQSSEQRIAISAPVSTEELIESHNSSQNTTDSQLRRCYTSLLHREEAKYTLEVGRLAGFEPVGSQEVAIQRIAELKATQ